MAPLSTIALNKGLRPFYEDTMRKPKKKIVCRVSFDAHTMKTARDMHCAGPVLNRGNTRQKWHIKVTVVTQPLDEEIHDSLEIIPDDKACLRDLNSIIAAELRALPYDRNSVKHLFVVATILD